MKSINDETIKRVIKEMNMSVEEQNSEHPPSGQVSVDDPLKDLEKLLQLYAETRKLFDEAYIKLKLKGSVLEAINRLRAVNPSHPYVLLVDLLQ